ncbi:conserved hypothetical protein [Pyrenophora tritici-repentis Pt-1C-BFP]|uniref:Uncharacterized protein n=1 Tax=Pyrenophora tritici-repentis (strain Pt-1C-BFP) TaxID=426418 RepID=B2WLR7_PYRTR|nr:uncharacterized protein PTRG_10927 [Pyrenophora tritici-repentis Pt-1C-BFP]EDU43977.1 conserved hypothetical protein [Pyrenophora tritici-repentis Pt-1C-BFP]
MKLFTSLIGCVAVLSSIASAVSITSTQNWNITNDPEGSARLNGVSFQQNPLTTFGDYQYVAFYSTASGYGKHYVNLGRRKISPSLGEWQYFALTDYVQQTLDEHNTISMGISGDGKIHLSFDHHDVPLNYRVSTTGIAKTIPTAWTASGAFGPVQHSLPGSTGPWTPLTYPRFESLDNGDLLMEFRIGQSGSGDSYIHRYSSSSGTWSAVGKYLQGANNNAYINGITNRASKLYVSWTVRETPDASTNHDFYFASSDDGGNSQIINQEAQCVDASGRFHALMRDSTSGTPLFYHYLRTSSGTFTKTPIRVAGLSTPPYLSYRGKITSVGDSVIAILPDQPKLSIQIWTASAAGGYADWKKLVEVPNSQGEPGVDEERLRRFGVLSLFVRQGGAFGTRKVQVWDFGVKA